MDTETKNWVIHVRYRNVGRRSFIWEGPKDVKIGDLVEVNSTTYGPVRAIVIGVSNNQRIDEWPATIKMADKWLGHSWEQMVQLAKAILVEDTEENLLRADQIAKLVLLIDPIGEIF